MRLPAALRPHGGEVNCALDLRTRGRVAHALVELHHDVGAQLLGNVHVLLGRPGEPAAVVVDRAKAHAVGGELAEFLVAKDLEATGVCEDGAVPAGEAMQATHLGNKVCAGTHGQVVGVGEDNLGAKLLELRHQDPLHRALGTHGHKDGRGHVAVRGVQDTRPRVRGRILGDNVVCEPLRLHHVLLLRHENGPGDPGRQLAHVLAQPTRRSRSRRGRRGRREPPARRDHRTQSRSWCRCQGQPPGSS